MRHFIRGSWAMLAALALALAGAARAQEADEARAHARAAFDQGQAEYNLGHFDKALTKYEEAYKYKPVPALLFNIAQCHRQLGDMKAAATTYNAFLRTARANDPNRRKAEALLAEVRAAAQRQQQAQEAKPLGTAVDGKQAALDSPPEIEASVALTDAAHEDQPAAEVAAEKKPIEVSLNTPRSGAPAPAVEVAPQPPAAPGPSRPLTWVAAGGAALALGGGALFGMKSKSTASDLESKPHPSADIPGLKSSVASDAGKANLLFVAGAVLAAAAGTFFVLEF